MAEKRSERISNGDTVSHFKSGSNTPLEASNNLYKYKVITTNARETDNYERVVVYQALYNNAEKGISYGDIFVRKYDEFMSEVDREKYPLEKYPQYTQKYRFEVDDD